MYLVAAVVCLSAPSIHLFTHPLHKYDDEQVVNAQYDTPLIQKEATIQEWREKERGVELTVSQYN